MGRAVRGRGLLRHAGARRARGAVRAGAGDAGRGHAAPDGTGADAALRRAGAFLGVMPLESLVSY